MSKKTKPRVYDKAGKQVKVADKSWYTFQASGEAEQRSIEIFVYGEIGAWGVTANQFVQDLRAMDDGASPVIVAFNSIGGDLFDGLAIHNALSRLGERCTGRIDALAASAASVAVCGAHRVVIAANAMLMIHNPYTFTGGDAEDFRRVADVLDQTLEAIIAAYKAKAPDIDDASKLALMVTKGCAAAGISNLVDPILAVTNLESEAVVKAALTKAKALHGLCVAARLPELTGEFISAGLDEAAVRARLFDKLVSSGGGFEINNSLPLDDDPALTVKAKQVDTQSIWAARQAAQNGTSKGVRA